MTRIHARALVNIEKISYSYSSSNLEVSIVTTAAGLLRRPCKIVVSTLVPLDFAKVRRKLSSDEPGNNVNSKKLNDAAVMVCSRTCIPSRQPTFLGTPVISVKGG